MNEDKEWSPKIFMRDLSNVPFHRLVGLNAENFDIENRCIRFEMRDNLVGNTDFKILHGGVIATLFDAEGAFILYLNGAWRPKTGATGTPHKVKGGTIDLHIDYLRPGKGKHFVVSGTILRHGSKVAVVRTELRDDQDELIATGTGTYLIG